MLIIILQVFGMINSVNGHGHMIVPKSRQQLANEVPHSSEFRDNCPHCTLAAPLLAVGNGAQSRGYPGNRAFSEPGTAQSETFLMNGETPFGVCGTEKLESPGNDYNYVSDTNDVWGKDVIVAEYEAGQIIDVEWCVNADHGGVYSWRLCDDPSLVEKLWRNYPMSSEEQEELEECYQRGILRCDDANDPNEECNFEPFCRDGWGCAEDFGKYFHCEGEHPQKAYSCRNTDESCETVYGHKVKRRVKIPEDFPSGKTVMTWRWDSHETTEVFAACADITIVNNNYSPEPTVSPKPTTGPTYEPTVEPTHSLQPTDSTVGLCCWWSSTSDICYPCESYSEPESWCGLNKERCDHCGGSWCDVSVPSPTSEPTSNPVPTVEPTPEPTAEPTYEPTDSPTFPFFSGNDFCCFDGTCDRCNAPVDFEFAFCALTENNCEGCGGVWCE